MLGQADTFGSQRLLLAWFKDADDEHSSPRGGFGGAVRQDAGDYLYPVDSNVAPASKINAIATRSLHLDVAIDPLGNARDTLDVTWDNPIDTALGTPYRELPALEDLRILGMYFRLLAPERSRVESVSGGSFVKLTAPAVVAEEAGRAVIGTYLMVPPGTTSLRYVWTSPYAADADETGGVYRLTIQKQPGLLPGPLTLTIHVPDGFRIASASAGSPGLGRHRDPDHDLQPGPGAGPALRRDRPAAPSRRGTSSARGYTRRPTTARGPIALELRHQLGVLRAWFWLLAASVLLAAGAAYLVSSSLPKVYEGKVTLIVGQSTQAANPDLNQLLASQRLSQTYADLATTGPLLEQVIAKNGLPITPDEFRLRIVADAPRDSTLVHLTVQDGDPARAAVLANSLAAEMIAASPAIAGRDSEVQQFVDTDLAAIQAQIEDTQTEIQRLTSLASRSASDEQQLQALQGRIVILRQTYATMLGFSSNSGANLLTVVDPASPPEVPASPRVLLNTILAAIVGLLIALGLAFLLEYFDDTVKSTDDVEAVVGLPTLGTITKMKGGKGRSEIYRLATLLYPRAPVAEAYRSLRTNIEFAAVDAPVKTLLVTSSIPAEGKTTTAANLAVVFAQTGRRTLLLDADFRKPGIHRILDLPNARGLSRPAALRWGGARRRGAAQRAGKPAGHHDRPAPAQPGRAARLAANADDPRAPRRGRGPRRHRQPTPPGGDGCRAPLGDHRWHAVRHRCRPDAAGCRPAGPRGAGPGRRPGPGRHPQPAARAIERRLLLLRLPERPWDRA